MCSSGGFPDHSYRWNMSVEDSVYCGDKTRTLSCMTELCKTSGQNCSKHKGCMHPPLLNVESSAVVLDELHLMYNHHGYWESNPQKGRIESENYNVLPWPNAISYIRNIFSCCPINFIFEIPVDTTSWYTRGWAWFSAKNYFLGCF